MARTSVVLPVCRAPSSNTTGVSGIAPWMVSSIIIRQMVRYSPRCGEFAGPCSAATGSPLHGSIPLTSRGQKTPSRALDVRRNMIRPSRTQSNTSREPLSYLVRQCAGTESETVETLVFANRMRQTAPDCAEVRAVSIPLSEHHVYGPYVSVLPSQSYRYSCSPRAWTGLPCETTGEPILVPQAPHDAPRSGQASSTGAACRQC